jgi:hypothetical protein
VDFRVLERIDDAKENEFAAFGLRRSRQKAGNGNDCGMNQSSHEGTSSFAPGIGRICLALPIRSRTSGVIAQLWSQVKA